MAPLVIGVDDSEIMLDGKPHTLLAAILIQDVAAVERALAALKDQFRIPRDEEIKWNGMKTALDKRQREELSQELLALLGNAVTLVTICEGRNRQSTAEHLVIQIADYLETDGVTQGSAAELILDEGIIDDPEHYRQFLAKSGRAPLENLAFQSVRSHDNVPIQLADIVAGFNARSTDIAAGRENKRINVWDDGFEEEIEIDLLTYIVISLRWSMWGEVPPHRDPENPAQDGTWPFKHVGGHGLRIHSSLPSELVEQIYSSRIAYMGCLH